MKDYYVYIMTNNYATLYTGVTNDLERRVAEHKRKLVRGFTKKYNITRLVHYEVFGDICDAIGREKQIKGWSRSRKVALIESVNPNWEDLSAGWFDDQVAAGAGERRAPGVYPRRDDGASANGRTA